MKNLKELKEALSKLPDEELENFYITHNIRAIEDTSDKMEFIWLGMYKCSEGDEFDEAQTKMISSEEWKVIQKFITHINLDMEEIIKCRNDEDYAEELSEKEFDNPSLQEAYEKD